MPVFTPSLSKLIESLRHLPGIGPKSAERIAFFLLKGNPTEAEALATAILEARMNVKACSRCFYLSDTDPCPLCRDSRRDPSLLCVVEDSRDVIAMERSGSFRGFYHVLDGSLSPIQNINEENLHVEELIGRVKEGQIQEVIVATNPTMNGDITCTLIAKRLKPLGIKVTRIAHGLPVGSDLELADEVTLGLALQGRREV